MVNILITALWPPWYEIQSIVAVHVQSTGDRCLNDLDRGLKCAGRETTGQMHSHLVQRLERRGYQKKEFNEKIQKIKLRCEFYVKYYTCKYVWWLYKKRVLIDWQFYKLYIFVDFYLLYIFFKSKEMRCIFCCELLTCFSTKEKLAIILWW